MSWLCARGLQLQGVNDKQPRRCPTSPSPRQQGSRSAISRSVIEPPRLDTRYPPLCAAPLAPDSRASRSQIRLICAVGCATFKAVSARTRRCRRGLPARQKPKGSLDVLAGRVEPSHAQRWRTGQQPIGETRNRPASAAPIIARYCLPTGPARRLQAPLKGDPLHPRDKTSTATLDACPLPAALAALSCSSGPPRRRASVPVCKTRLLARSRQSGH